MIKLVIVDMDGTFLDDEKKQSPEAFRVIKELRKKGVIFCVASGRQLDSLKKEFNGLEDDMIFIASNGTVVEFEGKIIVSETLSREISDDVISSINNMNGKKIIYCCSHESYLDHRYYDEYRQKIDQYFPKCNLVDTLHGIEELPAIMSIYTPMGADEEMSQLFDKYDSEDAKVCASEFDWIDVIPPGVNKGTAVKKVMNILGITPEETMAFGDQMNDYEMISSVYHSYAMENAHEEIKKIARYIAPRNTEYGVIQVIKKEFDIK